MIKCLEKNVGGNRVFIDENMSPFRLLPSCSRTVRYVVQLRLESCLKKKKKTHAAIKKIGGGVGMGRHLETSEYEVVTRN